MSRRLKLSQVLDWFEETIEIHRSIPSLSLLHVVLVFNTEEPAYDVSMELPQYLDGIKRALWVTVGFAELDVETGDFRFLRVFEYGH